MAVRKMPRFIPLSELSLAEMLLLPILGHAPVFGDQDRMNKLAERYGEGQQLAVELPHSVLVKNAASIS